MFFCITKNIIIWPCPSPDMLLIFGLWNCRFFDISFRTRYFTNSFSFDDISCHIIVLQLGVYCHSLKKKPFSFCYFYIIFWNSLFFTFLKIVWSQQNNSEKRFVLNEMLQYLPYTIYRKYFVVFFVFHFVQLYFYLYECIIYKGKSKVAQNLISKMSTDFLKYHHFKKTKYILEPPLKSHLQCLKAKSLCCLFWPNLKKHQRIFPLLLEQLHWIR